MVNLTTAQWQAWKAAILADAAINGQLSDHGAVAAYYNAPHASATVWRPSISIVELNTAIVWSEFEALSAGKRDCYMAMTQAGFVDATSSNVRAGFSSIFAGTSLSNLAALAKRPATRFENLFGVAASGSIVTPVFGYVVQNHDVANVLYQF